MQTRIKYRVNDNKSPVGFSYSLFIHIKFAYFF